MANLNVILADSMVGIGFSYAPGDLFPVVSQEQGDLMVERGMAAWPKPEPPVKPVSKKKEAPVAPNADLVADVAGSDATNANSDAGNTALDAENAELAALPTEAN